MYDLKCLENSSPGSSCLFFLPQLAIVCREAHFLFGEEKELSFGLSFFLRILSLLFLQNKHWGAPRRKRICLEVQTPGAWVISWAWQVKLWPTDPSLSVQWLVVWEVASGTCKLRDSMSSSCLWWSLGRKQRMYRLEYPMWFREKSSDLNQNVEATL